MLEHGHGFLKYLLHAVGGLLYYADLRNNVDHPLLAARERYFRRRERLARACRHIQQHYVFVRFGGVFKSLPLYPAARFLKFSGLRKFRKSPVQLFQRFLHISRQPALGIRIEKFFRVQKIRVGKA